MRYLPAMAELTSKQRAHLRTLAHSLKPILQVGKEGVTEEVASSVADAFQNRELLKVKVLESAPLDARDAAGELTQLVSGAHVVQVIGRTVALYRRHPERPEIRLPAPGPSGGPADG
jgi:RNA-binding protein